MIAGDRSTAAAIADDVGAPKKQWRIFGRIFTTICETVMNLK